MRRFTLERTRDVSGVSGIGTVAEGVMFSDGSAVIRWRGPKSSTVVWPSIQDAMDVHGHGGATTIAWIDG
ncbi:hypothetical protein [Mumia sp. DW29H23]|uniref:hypothetical protein n=1 Tax=Mumia sp. DW29H23 TaxID=3421241 RepID=UPI003D6898FF